MRIVLQRVTDAAVAVDGTEIARIGPGLLALVGVAPDDAVDVARALAVKTAALRIFAAGSDGRERSVVDIGGEILVVSQFTLMGDTRRGNRPSWSDAATADVAEPLVRAYADALRGYLDHVALGRFGADMAVTLTNDGPMTILLERGSRVGAPPARAPVD